MPENQQKIIQIYDTEGIITDTVEAEAIITQLVVKHDALEERVTLLENLLKVKEQQLLAEQVNLHDALEVIKKLSTHASKQDIPGTVEGSTHQENNSDVLDGEIVDIAGVKHLIRNSQTQVSGHRSNGNETQVKQANKAKSRSVLYTPDALCLDIGFRRCVEAGMSKSKLAAKFGVSESTVARAKRKL